MLLSLRYMQYNLLRKKLAKLWDGKASIRSVERRFCGTVSDNVFIIGCLCNHSFAGIGACVTDFSQEQRPALRLDPLCRFKIMASGLESFKEELSRVICVPGKIELGVLAEQESAITLWRPALQGRQIA